MQGRRGRCTRAAICAGAVLCVLLIAVGNATAAIPQLSKVSVSAVTSTSAVLEAKVNPQGQETTYRFEYGPEDCAKSTCTTVQGSAGAGSSPVRVSAPLEELPPATLYHYRVEVENSEGKAEGDDRIFATYSAPLIGLPDQRAYEQASPTNKDGNDALGDLSIVKASASGNGITFGSTFGIPGGKGAQALPSYLASRGTENWSTQGLLPPPSVGERAVVIGATPDYTEIFSEATKLGSTRFTALIGQSSAGGAPEVIAPYTADAEYAYAGSSADGSLVLFESSRRVPPKEGQAPNPQALNEAPNLYAWDSESGEVSLVGVRNNGTPPPKGAFAGPYDWSGGISARRLVLGGASGGYYLQGEHAIAPDGSIYFTEVGSGQLYLRRNPTAPQSAVVTNGKGEEECTEEGKACTIHVSASHKENGISLDGKDPAGPQPAAFQAATADGGEAFFTSPEKLTNDANTGPEQPLAQIERDDLAGGSVETPSFIPEHAVGVTVDSSHVYWANPKAGTIGRADLDGKNVVPAFITPGSVKFEFQFEVRPGVFEPRDETIESEPRYVAVDAGHVYWTNTGRSDSQFGAVDKEGTIGRAEINGAKASIEPAFIRGASNPQGIAVNASHIYWANAGRTDETRTIARAAIGGGEVKEGFHEVGGNEWHPYGVALNATHVYFDFNEENEDNGYLGRIPLEGGPKEFRFIGKAGVRGVAVDASHVYWATKGEEAIGRADLELENLDSKFIELKGKPNGVAVDGSHLYWATNGEAPTNPGNDLYRFTAPSAGVAGKLVDLTPDSDDENGAEVQGLVGASADGSYLYFAANGVLDEAEEAKPGNCHGGVGEASGSCNLYLWHEGAISFLARLRSQQGSVGSDSLNWTGTPINQFPGASYVPKSAFTSAEGQTLLFRSQEKLTSYENEGVPELYRFHVGEAKIRCVSCQPGGEAVGAGPKTGQTLFPDLGPHGALASVSSRNLSASGDQAFFETAEALSPLDTNGQGGDCPPTGTGSQNFPACNDVYEWEAPGPGSCQESSPSYSPINEGCIYLLSSGKDRFPSLFADASVSGKDVLFFTRQQLVGQDKDELQDVYDARVQGGLLAQNPLPSPVCESNEACHGPPSQPAAETLPVTPGFVGPANPPAKHKKQKHAKHKKHKHKRGHGSKKQKKAAAKGRGQG